MSKARHPRTLPLGASPKYREGPWAKGHLSVGRFLKGSEKNWNAQTTLQSLPMSPWSSSSLGRCEWQVMRKRLSLTWQFSVLAYLGSFKHRCPHTINRWVEMETRHKPYQSLLPRWFCCVTHPCSSWNPPVRKEASGVGTCSHRLDGGLAEMYYQVVLTMTPQASHIHAPTRTIYVWTFYKTGQWPPHQPSWPYWCNPWSPASRGNRFAGRASGIWVFFQLIKVQMMSTSPAGLTPATGMLNRKEGSHPLPQLQSSANLHRLMETVHRRL